MTNTGQFVGVFRGIVTGNADPEQIGRVQVKVSGFAAIPDALWAARCSPLAGKSKGAYFMPEPGDEVLVTFEQGDPRQPIVIGSLWSGTDKPPAAEGANPPESIIAIQSKAQHAFVIRDAPGPSGGVEIRSASGAVILVSNVGITINNGNGASIVLQGSAVTVNGRPLRF
jgi:uncharacterized protein involved in type VI secretion and phage assembly